jgi:hypothetical protein
MNFKNSFLISLLFVGLVACVTADDEVKPNIKIYVEKPIIHEVSADLINGKDVVDAVPLVKSDAKKIEAVEQLPKAEVDKAAADLLNKQDESSVKLTPIDKPAEPINKQPESTSTSNVDTNVQLPPMPLILPSFLSNFPPLPPFLKSIMENHQAIMNEDNNNFDLNDSSEDSKDQENDASSEEVESNDQSSNPKAGKHGIMSIFLFKSNRNPEQQQQQDDQSSIGGKTNLLIMKILPRPMIFGGDSDPDSKKTVHLMGGPSDPDHSPNFNKIHLFGGDSDSAERFRFGDHNMMMTGNEDSKINAYIQERHESILDKIKNFFKLGQFLHPLQQIDEQKQQQFLIRTDDGSPAFISNDIGAGSDLPTEEQAKKNKCMMLSFMRLKASAYYRTIVHLLFFTGIALFILFAGLLTMRTFKRRRNGFRYHAQQNMNIASIDAYPTKTTSNRLSWFKDSLPSKTSDLSSSLNQSLLMPQPPPAYDQVLITTGDNENESIVKQIPSKPSENNSLAAAYKSKIKDEDQKSIISMPPGYEDVNKENNSK